MNKNRKLINAFLVSTMVLSGLAPVASAQEAGTVDRLYGDTRVETSIAVSNEVYETAENVVIAGFKGEVDALTGTMLASLKDAPLLIVNESNTKDLKAKIASLGAKNVYLLGGETIISADFENELKNDYKVERVSGDLRYDTAVEVAKKAGDDHGHIFLTNDGVGKGSLADALAVGPVSGSRKKPVLLTGSDSLPAATEKAIKEFGVTTVTVIGGKVAVSDNVEKELKAAGVTNIERIAGDYRWDTAELIAAEYFAESTDAVITNDGQVSYADALMAGYLGAKKNAPVLLTPVNGLRESTKNYLGEKAMHAYVLGGEKVVSKTNFKAIEKVVAENVEEEEEEALEVESVSAINETGVDLVVKVTEAIEEATVEVKNSKGNIVPVDVRPLETDDKEVTFDFSTAVKSEDLVGTWTVNGVEFDLDEVAAVNAVNEAANAVELWDALQSNYFEGAIEENIVEYADAIAEEEPTTVKEVNEMIAKVNKEQLSDEAEAAIVKDVADAKNVLQLRNALVKGNFARVNDDWITDYATAPVDGTEMLKLDDKNYFGETAGVDFEAIQDAIYAVNKSEATEAVKEVIDNDGKVETFKIADVTKARKAVEDFVKADKDNNTDKKAMLDQLELAEAIISVNTANTNARLSAALNKLAVADKKNAEQFDLEIVEEDLMSDYRTTIGNKTNKNEIATVSLIKNVITTVNAELGGFELDLGKDEEFVKINASGKIDKAFDVKAVTKDGEKVYGTATNKVEIKVGNKVVNKEGLNLTDGKLTFNSSTGLESISGLNKIGDLVDVEIVVYDTKDGKEVVVETIKTKMQLVTRADATNSVLKTNKEEYKTGEDIELSLELKDDKTPANTVLTENGKYASTVTVGDTKHNVSIQFKDGKATVVVPARDATGKVDVKVSIPKLNLTDITSEEKIEVKADTFSKLEIKDLATTGFELFATDGINKLEVADQLVNVKVVDSKGNDVKVTGADYQGNLTATVPVGGLSVGFDSPLQAEETYTITVTIGEVEATQTKTMPKEVDSTVFVKTNGELHNALGNPEVTTIVLDEKVSGAGVRAVNRPITLDLNGYDITGSLTFKYDAEGTSEIKNSGTAATVNTVTVDTPNASFVHDTDVTVSNLNLVDVASETYTNYGTIEKAVITDKDARFLNEGTVTRAVVNTPEGNVTFGGSSAIEVVQVEAAESVTIAEGAEVKDLKSTVVKGFKLNNKGTAKVTEGKVTVSGNALEAESEGDIETDGNIAKTVSDEAELKAALANKSIDTIKLSEDITITKALYVKNKVVIDGNGKTLTVNTTEQEEPADQHGINAMADGVTIKDLTVTGAKGSGVQILNNATIINVNSHSNKKVGFYVNNDIESSKITVLFNSVTTSENEWKAGIGLVAQKTDSVVNVEFTGNNSFGEAVGVYSDNNATIEDGYTGSYLGTVKVAGLDGPTKNTNDQKDNWNTN